MNKKIPIPKNSWKKNQWELIDISEKAIDCLKVSLERQNRK